MKSLVTGGTGFLGSHLVDRLLESPEAEVYALVRDPQKLRWLDGARGAKLLHGDLFNIPALPAGLDVVYHSAGLTKTLNSSAYYTVNQEGTASLLEALAAQGQAPRVVHLSSLAAGGPSSPGKPVLEDDLPRPVSPYGLSKLKAEEEALKHKDRFPLVILRVGAVFGPRDEDFLDYFRWIKRGVLPLLGREEKLLSVCYVKDVTGACLSAARPRSSTGNIINIANAKPVSWEEFGRAAARILNRKVRRIRLPRWLAYGAAAGADALSRVTRNPGPLNLNKFREMKAAGWAADVRKAKDILGFEARYSLEEALQETLTWYRQKGLL